MQNTCVSLALALERTLLKARFTPGADVGFTGTHTLSTMPSSKLEQ
jgi:hypothetical protein